ncbi:MAG: ABC transporter ATP-binding protein [candidate division KSB1 bacterium]|nr:ABC transporter ATP-binding protein [candidate division KSB1 bacterium]
MQEKLNILRGQNRYILKRFLQYLKPFTRVITVMYVFALLNVAATLAIPILIQKGIDKNIANDDLHGLLITTGVLAAVLVVQFISFRYQGVLLMRTANEVFYRLRRDLFEHMQKLSFRFFDTHKAGSLMTRVTSDVQVLEELLMTGLDTILVDFLMIGGIIGAMLFLDARLSLILLFIIPLLSLVVFGLRKRIVNAARDIQKQLSSVNAYLNESLSGIMVSRAFAREKLNIRQFSDFNEAYFQRTRSFYPLHAYFWQSVSTLNTFSMGLVILVGGILLYQQSVTIGVIAAFLTLITQLFHPMQKISNMLNQLSRAMASGERIFSILDERPDVQDQDNAIKNNQLKGKIEFNHVKFEYKSDEPVLKGIHFIVQPGQTLAIVGHTGSGKSTIVNLLSRFYDVTGGKVCVDDRDVREYAQHEYRIQTAVVMQDPFLFSGSVYDNIRFSMPEATQEQIEGVCKELGIHEMVQEFPRAYHTEIGERGGNISIGQKQLLAFARAMLRDPRILILDEASSYLDTRTEALVQQALQRLMKDRTTIVIAHRLSTIQYADTILVLEQGNILESGTHEELVRHNGAYAQLLKSQFQQVAD